MTTRYVFSFSLRAVCLALLVVALLVTGIAVQNLQLHRLTRRVDQLQRSEQVLLYRIPSEDSVKTGAYIGGQNVFFDKTAEFSDRENSFVVRNNGAELVVELNGTPIVCQTLEFDAETGRWTKDDPRFFERLGLDFDGVGK